MESTLIIIKPDAVERGLTGKILDRYLQKGYIISEMKMLQISDELAGKHYAEHDGNPFFDELVSFITSGASVALILTGGNVIAAARKMNGATNPQYAEPGTIRGDFAHDIAANLVHASDSPESAEREIKLFFGGI